MIVLSFIISCTMALSNHARTERVLVSTHCEKSALQLEGIPIAP